MNAFELTITDTHGDDLEIATTVSGSLFIDGTASEDVQDWLFNTDEAERLAKALNEWLGTGEDRPRRSAVIDPNEAKLRVAADHGLRVKFDYKGEDDYAPEERRVEPDNVWSDASGHVLVGGESYDEDGDGEGYRQFRLDRIHGAVVVR